MNKLSCSVITCVLSVGWVSVFFSYYPTAQPDKEYINPEETDRPTAGPIELLYSHFASGFFIYLIGIRQKILPNRLVFPVK